MVPSVEWFIYAFVRKEAKAYGTARLAEGAPTCLTVTLLDGLVLARSTFESSMNYRSVMVLGSCSVLRGAAKDAALQRITVEIKGAQAEDRRELVFGLREFRGMVAIQSARMLKTGAGKINGPTSLSHIRNVGGNFPWK